MTGCSVQKPASPEQLKSIEEEPAAKKTIKKKVFLDSRFTGTWNVEDSTAQFLIENKNGVVKITGKDREDHEPFIVSNVKWDQLALYSEVMMPSTNHTISIKLTIVNDQKLLCKFSGNALGTAAWLRKN